METYGYIPMLPQDEPPEVNNPQTENTKKINERKNF
jgi:hypothetical protein